jgi:hypothetical protein
MDVGNAERHSGVQGAGAMYSRYAMVSFTEFSFIWIRTTWDAIGIPVGIPGLDRSARARLQQARNRLNAAYLRVIRVNRSQDHRAAGLGRVGHV